jgi:hypothetical protein
VPGTALAHIASNVGDKTSAMIRLGRVLLALGDTQSSVRVLGKALPTVRDTGNSRQEASIYGLLGEAYMQAARLDKALTFCTQQVRAYS